MQALDGFLNVTFLARRDGEPCQVKVQTRWRDMAAITAFAGETPAKTVLPDFMAPFFKTYDDEASFYDEVLQEDAA